MDETSRQPSNRPPLPTQLEHPQEILITTQLFKKHCDDLREWYRADGARKTTKKVLLEAVEDLVSIGLKYASRVEEHVNTDTQRAVQELKTEVLVLKHLQQDTLSAVKYRPRDRSLTQREVFTACQDAISESVGLATTSKVLTIQGHNEQTPIEEPTVRIKVTAKHIQEALRAMKGPFRLRNSINNVLKANDIPVQITVAA